MNVFFDEIFSAILVYEKKNTDHCCSFNSCQQLNQSFPHKDKAVKNVVIDNY